MDAARDMGSATAMEWPDVQRRIAGGESACTEFNRGVGDLSAVGRTLCAFANSSGGVTHSLGAHEK